MTMLGFTLPPLGLVLYLGLHFSSVISINSKDTCVGFDQIFTTTNPGIKANPDVFENNTVYTVWVPVSDNVRAVVLRVVDKNNTSVGLWSEADDDCHGSAWYRVTHLKDVLFGANWTVPNSKDVTEVQLQVFTVYLNNTATFSSLKLEGNAMPTTLISTTKISGNNYTTATTTMTTPMTTAETTTTTPAMTTTTTPAMTTTKTLAMTTTKTPAMTTTKTPAMTTTRSLGIRVLSSPTAGAIHILLVFLTSKLLF